MIIDSCGGAKAAKGSLGVLVVLLLLVLPFYLRSNSRLSSSVFHHSSSIRRDLIAFLTDFPAKTHKKETMWPVRNSADNETGQRDVGRPRTCNPNSKPQERQEDLAKTLQDARKGTERLCGLYFWHSGAPLETIKYGDMEE